MQSQIKLVDPVKAKAYFQDKIDFTTGPVELSHMIQDGLPVNIVDVRETEDFEEGHIRGSVNLPHDKWETLEGLRKDRMNILLCYSQQCHLAAKAAVLFAERGYSVMEMDGGFKAWKESDLEVERVSVNRIKGDTLNRVKDESVNRIKGLFHKRQ
ncbi:MAG: Sulfurtransferase [Verrucomicrobiales bacterium]|nr:Sulfurtransferase [Verrucomicrobiales bacterium]